MTKPFILITNDDGIHAPGIKHLAEAIREHADVAIVAPHAEKSGSGLSITWTKPLHIRPYTWEHNIPAWSLNGTPADCVKMALAVLLEKMPDMVVSGINRGSNSGRTVLYSGTIGGVIEAVLKGIPGIAFSYSDVDEPPVFITKKMIFPIIQHFLKHLLPAGTLLNVNFPYHLRDGIKGIRMAKQGKSYWKEDPDRRIHPEGAPYYWLGGAWGSVQEDPESDVALLEQGYIAIAPIQVGELTCKTTFETHKNFSEKTLALEISECVSE
ncbi:MAG: 5'/3'-nucleotidase SurE [Chlamydiae bacterium RIFCSPHIGHO2_12_FULL_44_59]|nr:MAG: 5'/3'-nucleotidase SurE [Chlamydiae bacterium RIFCSPHIGHO2_01_FULL_44_39]OGN57009.1 MAG: 5'/3'-nucleotidase SurE [Chlamydiae bacterium RIFCSPHIGHO2_02_FULL_45_9]OGN59619.1 MAG: 5'/3'-nucleotidase SurE [Chlamydiae bacterium RIFCSPHIGHO2_12_FULL_44_59]OGN65709.1 MAG: 5'/3'-nucleotidase SurE [Chlamydiae bacterium RIFCSPLOWO2_01_FULL_44_52]OGN67851.1 MAG: 5'/3'-nucleotidase SurE [Chlamydiae bacterium RIFCSPLOWO2_02_FULL_45_22]OGN69342.1 MAG: 5'/3'-nucleotidase SurE [Chlamydiae bacterium RI